MPRRLLCRGAGVARQCVHVWLVGVSFFCFFDVTCCMVGMRKSLRIRGSSDVREHSGAFWFPAFLLCVLLGKLSSDSMLTHCRKQEVLDSAFYLAPVVL